VSLSFRQRSVARLFDARKQGDATPRRAYSRSILPAAVPAASSASGILTSSSSALGAGFSTF